MRCDECEYEATSQMQLWGHYGSKHVKKLRPIAHGTQRGYQACLRRNGKACPACRRANVIDKTARRRSAARSKPQTPAVSK